MEIEITDLSYAYNKKNNVLNHLSAKIESNKINTIIGPTGSGKTTLVKLIGDLIKKQTGIIQIEGYALNKETRPKLGILPQNYSDMFYNKTVKEEIAVGLKNFKKEVTDTKISEIINLVNLDNYFLSANPFDLDETNKFKVALASILVYSPELIIFDEPTANLDSKSKKEFLTLLKTLKKDYNKTILIVSNNAELAYSICDYIYVLDKGKIVLEGNKYDVFKEEKLLNEHNIKIPKIISFSNYVLENKNKKMGYRDQINDLIKDIYRYAK